MSQKSKPKQPRSAPASKPKRKRVYAISAQEVHRRVGPTSPLSPQGKEKFKVALQQGKVKVKKTSP